MKTIKVCIDSSEREECIADVGKIISMTNWDMDTHGGFATLKTTEGIFTVSFKPNAVLCLGVVGFENDEIGHVCCSDPRVIMMYMWRLRQYRFKEPETDPPVPTREEAIEWMKEMDIPLEPQAVPRDWTSKLKRNFLNIKD